MKRTTIFAEEETLLNLKRIAEEEGETIAEVIRRALQTFVHKRYKKKKAISFIGVGRSGRKDVSEKAEELLWKQM